MFQIRDWLFISGFPTASNEKIIESNNIEAMLQLFEPIQYRGMPTLYLNVLDGKEIEPQQIKEGVAFIREQHAAGRRILVTCGAGVSRSVTFSVAGLKEIEGLSLEEAYRSIREQHQEALPDHIHWDGLRKYYEEGPEFWRIWQDIVLDDEGD